MMPPRFWQRDGVLPRLLSPAAAVVARLTARRVAAPGWWAPVPVLCCGNAGVGGAGKTTLVLDLVQRLQQRGVRVHCLTRGYGGRVRDVLRVDPREHRSDLVEMSRCCWRLPRQPGSVRTGRRPRVRRWRPGRRCC